MIHNKLLNFLLGSNFFEFNLGQLQACHEEVPHDRFVSLASHSILVDQGPNYFLDMAFLKIIFDQIDDNLTDLKYFIVQIVRDAVAKHHKKFEQEFP